MFLVFLGIERKRETAPWDQGTPIPPSGEIPNNGQCEVEVRQTGNHGTITARDKAVMRKLDMLVADYPDIYKLTGQDEVSKTYSLPKSFIGCCKPRAVSTEQRERAKQMMIARNKAKRD